MASKPLLLIIDDNEDFIDQYCMLAHVAGYDVEGIPDGRTAIQRLKKGLVPDLVLLDSILPYASGDEVLAALRANKKWAQVPVYILTADIRVTRGFRDRLPDAPRANGILEKGAQAITQVRELLARYKDKSTE